jgi:exosortase A-associated hydrolase 1
MKYVDHALSFACQGDTLQAVLSMPAPDVPATDLGMVIVVGGPQYRAGSHRLFVKQARSAAAAGVPTLRFDLRGMGDSTGALRSFEHVSQDIGAAIDALQQHASAVRRVVLWGLCDGASAALLYLADTGHDPRVQGLCLLNPWVRSEATLAATHVKHYYAQRLLQRDFWAKVVRGQVAVQALRGLIGSLLTVLRPRHSPPATSKATKPPYPQRMACAWERFGGRILLVLSGNDYTAKEFLQAWASDTWAGARGGAAPSRIDLSDADHTFSTPRSQARLQAGCNDWLVFQLNSIRQTQVVGAGVAK